MDVGDDRDPHLYSLSGEAARRAYLLRSLLRARRGRGWPRGCSPRASARSSRTRSTWARTSAPRRSSGAGASPARSWRSRCRAPRSTPPRWRLLVRRPPRRLLRRISEPVARRALRGGAALSVALSLPSLPLAVLARRRAIRVGTGHAIVARLGRRPASRRTRSRPCSAAGGGARRGGRDPPLSARAGGRPPPAGRSRSARCSPRSRRSCSTRSSTTSRRCPRGRRAPTCSSWPRAAGVKVGEVYSVDASRRTTAANAYVTGLGPTKRVVLFDTLLDRYSRDEVRVVVAHELAHVRSRDVPRGVLFAAIVAPAAALAVQRLSWRAVATSAARPRRCPALALSAAVRLGTDRADRQPPVARDRATRRRVLARAVRRARRVRVLRAGDRAPERRRSRPAALGHDRCCRRIRSTAERIGAALAYARMHRGLRARRVPNRGRQAPVNQLPRLARRTRAGS